MFRDRVVAHYVNRGYTVEADRIVTGESGSPHRPHLIAAGDLGDLAIYFGDEEPLIGPELGSIRRAARDLGAGAVVAVPETTAKLRESAREHRIILVDQNTLDPEHEDQPLIETIDHQWSDPAKAVAAEIFEEAEPDEQPEAPRPSFDWLPSGGQVEPGAVVATTQTVTRSELPLPWLLGPLLYLVASLILLVVAGIIFL